MRKIKCFVVLLATNIHYGLTQKKLDYWSWLFQNAANSKFGAYREHCVIAFLFGDALSRKDHSGVCAVYGQFCDYFYKQRMSKKILLSMQESCLKEGRHDYWSEIEEHLTQKHMD